MAIELSAEVVAEITKAGLEAAQAPSDPTGLLKTVAAIRSQMADPNSPIYANRPDLVDAKEHEIAAMLLRAGIATREETPLERAQADHASNWQFLELAPAVQGIIDDRLAELAPLPAHALSIRQQDLAVRLGYERWKQLCDDAKGAMASTDQYERVFADERLLGLLAQRGRYLKAERAARPSASPTRTIVTRR